MSKKDTKVEKYRKEQLLDNLKEEREKFTQSDKTKMQKLIDELVQEGVYPSEPTPAMKQYNYSILTMVESWGEDWYAYGEPFECPHCGANLKDEKSGPPFKREIGISDFFLDCRVDSICPDCYRSLDSGRQYNKKDFENSTVPE